MIEIDKKSKFVILSPHPDDELHMAYSWIKEYPENAIIAIFTTGKAGIDESGRHLKSSYLVAERYKESILGMNDVDLSAEQLLFFGFSDGREDENSTIIDRKKRIGNFSATIEYLEKRYNPQFFISPLPMEFHIDHQYMGFALLNAKITARKIFSCYPKSVQVPPPDFCIEIPKKYAKERVKICEESYSTQSFLCRKLKDEKFTLDRYWYSETIEKFLEKEEEYQIISIKNTKDKKIFQDLFDTEEHKRSRVLSSLKKKYKTDKDPWNYKTSFYEKTRIETVGKILDKSFKKSTSIIDVGCGNGELLKHLYNIGFRNIEGTDIFAVTEKEDLDISFKIEDFALTINRISTDNDLEVLLLSDVVYYIHFLEFNKLVELLNVPSIIFCGGDYDDIRPYILSLLKYYDIYDGSILEFAEKQTFFLNLKKRKINAIKDSSSNK